MNEEHVLIMPLSCHRLLKENRIQTEMMHGMKSPNTSTAAAIGVIAGRQRAPPPYPQPHPLSTMCALTQCLILCCLHTVLQRCFPLLCQSTVSSSHPPTVFM